MKAYGGIWSPDRLDAFLTKPKDEVKGTKMGFAGLKKDDERADVIAYLNSSSDAPLDLAVDSATPDQGAAETETESELGLLVSGPGAEETYNNCTACHSERIVAQQGLTKSGWEELLEWMVEEQGMAEIEEPDYSLIINYLAENYNTDRAEFSEAVRRRRENGVPFHRTVSGRR